MNCSAVKAKYNHIERCQSEAVVKGLCPLHYVLSKRMQGRHNRILILEFIKLEEEHGHQG